VGVQRAVPDVERLVVDQQPDQLAVGDVDDRLAGLGVAVTGLGVGQRPLLEERVQVRARQSVRLPLVEVAAEPDVPVGEGEYRLALREQVHVEPGFLQTPRLNPICGLLDHALALGPGPGAVGVQSRRLATSVTTTSAPCWRSASQCPFPTRSTPTVSAKCPACPASTPARNLEVAPDHAAVFEDALAGVEDRG